MITPTELADKRAEIQSEAAALLELLPELRAAGDRRRIDAVLYAASMLAGFAAHPLLDLLLDEELAPAPGRRVG